MQNHAAKVVTFHTTEQFQLVQRNDHLNKTGHNSKTNWPNSILWKDSDGSELQLLKEIYRLNVWGMVFSLNFDIINITRFTEFTNYNLSQRSVELTWYFFNDVEEHEFPSNCTKLYLKLGEGFFTVTWVLEPDTVWNQKKIGLLNSLKCEAACLKVFTTMCPKEQYTSDYLIV